MSTGSSTIQTLRFGDGQSISLELDAGQLAFRHEPPAPARNVARQIQEQLESPLDFPALELALVPSDNVVLALDRHVPVAETLIAAIWPVLERRSIAPENVTILQPASWQREHLRDPRSQLPSPVREAMRWILHDATDASRERFLANSANGDRIYLDQAVVDADFVLPIGTVEFDPLLGFRSAASAIFPGLSNIDSMAKTRGQDHAELRPDDDRPLRQLQDEVAWLLGVQFGIQALPGRHGSLAGTICGALEATTSAAQKWLRKNWLVERPQRSEVVVAAVEFDAEATAWERLGAAVQTARNLVQRGGKIVLLTNLKAEPLEAFQFLQRSETPREALKPLRLEAPPGLIPAGRIASAADWATVYLLSELESGLVESLFMTPLDTSAEVARLLARGGDCVLLESAQLTFGYVA
jgi:nickel-dependent lactate racemase